MRSLRVTPWTELAVRAPSCMHNSHLTHRPPPADFVPYTCRCHPVCTHILQQTHRELAQITLPAGLISQADGESIKELLRKGPVSVALNWTDLMPKASKVGGGGVDNRAVLQQ